VREVREVPKSSEQRVLAMLAKRVAVVAALKLR